jgi:hypothetical protein
MVQNEIFSTLKTLYFRMYTFQKLTKFSPGNNVLDALGFYMSKDIYFFINSAE